MVAVRPHRPADGEVVVASASKLPEDLRSQVVEALGRCLGQDITPKFETAPELIAGLEVRSKGHALNWTLRQYLDDFGEAVNAAVRDELPSDQPSEES